MPAIENMNEQDVNENGCPGRCCYIDGYLCSVFFFDVFSLILLFRIGQLIAPLSSLSLIHFRMLEVHSRCVCSREAHSEHIL